MVRTRTEFENRLLQSQKLEAVGQLAGGIAHDFNNLLAAITGFGHILLDDLEGDPRRDDVNEIVKAADRGGALIRRLLTFSRREVTSPKVLQVSAAIHDAAGLLRQVIREDIALTDKIDPGCWNVFIDPVAFDQILVNLVVNARDAMPQGGTITIAASNRTLDETGGYQLEAGDYVALSVTDTGEGMSQSVRDRIFEPFFTTKDPNKGTGLGLSVVYGLAQEAGGSIEVESELGSGTTFTLLFPRTTAVPDGDEELSPVETRASRGLSILLVEDEEMVRKSTTRILERNNFTVVATDSGVEALEMLAGGLQVDLLLTDLIMPEMPGIELARRAGLPVVYLSGYSDSVLANAQDRLNDSADILDPKISLANNFVEKPFKPAALLAAIQKALIESK